MAQKTYTQAVRPSALLDELYAAHPALQPAVNPQTGEREQQTYLYYHPATTTLRLSWPDAVSVAAIDAIVAGHDPATPSAGEQQAAADAADLDDLLDNAQQAAVLLGWNPTTRQWAAAGNQWDSLTAAQRTTFMRRFLRAVVVTALRVRGT